MRRAASSRRRLRRALLASALLFGCALSVPPAALGPHLAPDIPEDALGRSRLRLGVAPFIDARSRLDRSGASPQLQLHWYGLARRGENRTGDAAFVGDVAGATRADAMTTLARTGAFSEVRPVEASDADASQVARVQQLDLVLTASIESLAGVQLQDLTISFGLVGWFRNRLSEPEGIASVQYRLYDREGLRFETLVEARHSLPGSTIAQAAADAMAKANERMAEQTYRWVSRRDRPSFRTVPVLVLDGCDLGSARSARLMQETSRVFEREADVEFAHTWRPHPAQEPSDDLRPALDRLDRIEPDRDGIVLAFLPLASRGLRLSDPPYGLAPQLGRRAVVGCAPDGAVRPLTILHEVGHLFGAVHVRDRSSVMHPRAEFDARFFDLYNRRILRATRGRPFGDRLPEAMARPLAAIYRDANPDQVYPAELESALRTLEAQRGAIR